MLTNKRIKEAENNTNKYIQEGLLRKSSEKTSKSILIKNSKDSLKAANILLKNNIPLWTIVTAYYAMFYIANAVLIENGYKTGEKIVHKITADALISIIRHKLKNNLLSNYEEAAQEALKLAEIKSDEIINTFDFERRKRNHIQYQTTNEDITSKAKTSFNRAKEFIFEMECILEPY